MSDIGRRLQENEWRLETNGKDRPGHIWMETAGGWTMLLHEGWQAYVSNIQLSKG